MAWALILAVAKRIGIEDRAIRAGGWQTGFPIPLAGKTLGLLGAGNLGYGALLTCWTVGMVVGSVGVGPRATHARLAATATGAVLLQGLGIAGAAIAPEKINGADACCR